MVFAGGGGGGGGGVSKIRHQVVLATHTDTHGHADGSGWLLVLIPVSFCLFGLGFLLWPGGRGLQVFAGRAEPLLLVLVLDGRLDGLEEVLLRLQDLLDGVDPLAGGLLARPVAHEGPRRRRRRRRRGGGGRRRRGRAQRTAAQTSSSSSSAEAAASSAEALAVVAVVVAVVAGGVARVRRFHDELERLAQFGRFESFVQRHLVHLHSKIISKKKKKKKKKRKRLKKQKSTPVRPIVLGLTSLALSASVTRTLT